MKFSIYTQQSGQMYWALLECIFISGVVVGVLWGFFSRYLKRRGEKKTKKALRSLNRFHSFDKTLEFEPTSLSSPKKSSELHPSLSPRNLRK